jgi:DNA-binding transcriptional MerR regulator
MSNVSTRRLDVQTLTIAEVSERTGLSQDTLRYYEKAGLIEPVGRTSGNHRSYCADDLEWLAFLLRLRQTGMSIADMQHFAELRSAGPATIAERLSILREHQRCLQDRIRALRRSSKALDDKINTYQQLLTKQHEGITR